MPKLQHRNMSKTGHYIGAILPLGKSKALVGFTQEAPLQVWTISVETKQAEVEFEGKRSGCRSIVGLGGGRVAVACQSRVDGKLVPVVSVFDLASGKSLQDITGDEIDGMVCEDGHLIGVGKTDLIVWDTQPAAGQVCFTPVSQFANSHSYYLCSPFA